jgi:hypothetical protein
MLASWEPWFQSSFYIACQYEDIGIVNRLSFRIIASGAKALDLFLMPGMQASLGYARDSSGLLRP